MEDKLKRKRSTGNMGKAGFEENIWKKETRGSMEEKDKSRVSRFV